jgi:hypothetical protein
LEKVLPAGPSDGIPGDLRSHSTDVLGEYVILVLATIRRKVVHSNIIEKPTAEWTAQQIVEVFPWDKTPRFLLRDRDSIYGASFRRRMNNLGFREGQAVRRPSPQPTWTAIPPVIPALSMICRASFFTAPGVIAGTSANPMNDP